MGLFSALVISWCFFFFGGLYAVELRTPASRPLRKITIDVKRPLRLTHTNTEIILSDTKSPTARFAAEELQSFLSRILGGRIPMVLEKDSAKNSIFVGIGDFSRNAGIDENSLCRDAFIIKRKDNSIFILGRDDPRIPLHKVLTDIDYGGSSGLLHERGSLFGVYDFLERFCGVRFYHASDLFTIVPRRDSIQVPMVDIYDRPDYAVRNYTLFANRADDDIKEPGSTPYTFFSHSKALNYCRFRADTERIPNAHGLRDLFYIERFSKKHPDYFALHSNGKRYFDSAMEFSGQLCFSSGIQEEIFQDAKAILSGDPDKIKQRSPLFYDCHHNFTRPWSHTPGKFFNFMPQDAYYHCRCEECSRHMSSPQAISNFLWEKVAALGRRLKAENIPGYVTAMAYPPCHIPPVGVSLPDNVLVMVAQNGPWDSTSVHRKNMKLLDAWKRLTTATWDVWMWNYVNKVPSRNLVLPGISCSTPWAVGRYYSKMKGKISGAFLEAESSSLEDYYMMHVIDFYVFCKVCWDNDIDVEKVMQEYFSLCYGEGADEIEKIYRLIEKIWLEKIAGNIVMTNLGPTNIPPTEYQLWRDIYNEDCLKEIESHFSKAAKLVKQDSLFFRRICYMKKVIYDNMIAQYKAYKKRTDSIASLQEYIDHEKTLTLWLQPLTYTEKPFPETRVTITDHEKTLKITVRCQEPNIKQAIASKFSIDNQNLWQDNEVEIFLNPSCDRVNYYHWIISSGGAYYDAQVRKVGPTFKMNPFWDSRSKIMTHLFDDHWIAEISINKEACGLLNSKRIVANFARHRAIANQEPELYSWSPFLDKGFHDIDRFGTISLSKNPGKNILRHGSFESDNWHRWGGWQKQFWQAGETRDFDRQAFVYSNKSLKLDYRGPVPEKRKSNVGQTLYEIKPNTRYRLSFYIRTDGIIPHRKGFGACVRIWNTRKNFWFPASGLTGTMPWTRQAFEFTTLPDTDPKTTDLNCAVMFASGTAWFDGIVLEEVSE